MKSPKIWKISSQKFKIIGKDIESKKIFIHNKIVCLLVIVIVTSILVLCQDSILFVDDFSLQKTPSSNGRKYFISAPSSSSSELLLEPSSRLSVLHWWCVLLCFVTRRQCAGVVVEREEIAFDDANCEQHVSRRVEQKVISLH